MVITLHRCSYDNSTISSVNKLKQYDASLLFSLLSLFFLSLFFLICFLSLCQIRQRVVLLNLLDTKVNTNCVLFHRGQGSVALAVGALGVVWNFFSRLSFLFSFSLWETARCRLKYCLKGPLNPKQITNQIQSWYENTSL